MARTSARARPDPRPPQHLYCDACLTGCPGRAPRTGFRVIAGFVKICPTCWPRLEPIVLALTDARELFLELALRRAIAILNLARGAPVLPHPTTVAQRVARELLPAAFASDDDDSRPPGVILVAPIRPRRKMKHAAQFKRGEKPWNMKRAG